MDIEELNVSYRAYSRFAREGIKTIDQLCLLSRDELFRIDGIGETTINEIESALAGMGLSLMTSEKLQKIRDAAIDLFTAAKLALFELKNPNEPKPMYPDSIGSLERAIAKAEGK